MTQPGSVSQVTVKAGIVTSLGTIVAGTLIANTSTASAIYVSQSTSVSATNGLRVGPLGSVSWTDSTPCYIAVDGQLDVTVTLSTVSANLSSPLDVADAIHKDGVSISGPVTIDGTVPIDGTVTISAPVTIDGTVPITGTVNANISGPVTVESGSTPLDVTGSTVNVNPVTIDGTVDVAGNVALTGPVAISGTVPISGDVGVSGPVTVTGTVDATIPGNVTVVTPAGTPLDVSVPGTVAISAIGSTVNVATPSPIDVAVNGTVNVNPVTIEGTVPVTGTVELGSGTTVSITGGVDVTGPVTVDGNVSITNNVPTTGVNTLISSIVMNSTNPGPINVDVSGYMSLMLRIVNPLTAPPPTQFIFWVLYNTDDGYITPWMTTKVSGLTTATKIIMPNYCTTMRLLYSQTGSNTTSFTVDVIGLTTPVPYVTTSDQLSGSFQYQFNVATTLWMDTSRPYGGQINGTVTYFNTSASPITLLQSLITFSDNSYPSKGDIPIAVIPAGTLPAYTTMSLPVSARVNFGAHILGIVTPGGSLPDPALQITVII